MINIRIKSPKYNFIINIPTDISIFELKKKYMKKEEFILIVA